MLLDGNILSTAESLLGLLPVPLRAGEVRDSEPDAFSGRVNRSAGDACRAENTGPRKGRLKPRLIPGFRGIRTSQAHPHTPGRTASFSVHSRTHEIGRVLPGSRPGSRERSNGSTDTAANAPFCALSYFSLTLCCVTPGPGWRGGHATLHSAGAGLDGTATGRPESRWRDLFSSGRVRPQSRHLLTHLPDVGQALKLYPRLNGITNLGREFVQGQIGPIDCKEEMERKSFASVRACGSKGCEKRLYGEGREDARPSPLSTLRLRPVFP